MKKVVFNISGMHCASCAGNVEGALKKVSGVLNTQVNFALEKAYVEFEPKKTSVGDLISAVEKSGYKAKTADTSMATGAKNITGF